MSLLGRHVLGQIRSQTRLGQLDWIPTLISAGLQAGSAAYGAHMQETIAKMQVRTQKEIQAKQDAQAAAAAKAAADAAANPASPAAQAAAAAANPTILGINQGVFIAGGVGLALMLGVVAVVASRSSSKQEPVRNAA